jgi:hypothetical protein
LTKSYEIEIKALKKELYHLTWYMRGGVSIDWLFEQADINDVEILSTIIKENMESTKKSGMPLI